MSKFDSVVDKIKNTKKGKEQFNISDLARLFDITSETLRKYEKKNIIEPLRLDNGYRVYSSWDITKIIRARQLKSECSSLLEVDNHLLEMDSNESIKIIESKQKEILREIEEKQVLLTWLDNRKQLIKNYHDNSGKVYRLKEEKIYCCIYMVHNTITTKTGEELARLQEWMDALPYTSVYYVGINENETISCVGITESERKTYHLEHLVPDFIIPESEYIVYNDYAMHDKNIDTSDECIKKGYSIANDNCADLDAIFVCKMIEYVQKDGLYSSHNLMMFSIKN